MKTTKQIARELGLLRRRSSVSGHEREIKKAQRCEQEFSFLIVIDFESTCWEEKERNTCQEIIEFPAVLLNTSTGAVLDEFHSYVLPMERPTLSKFCTEFTGITQTMVETGAPLCVILSQFLKWMKKIANTHDIDYHTTKENKKLCTLVTWSDWDLGLCLLRECQRKQLLKPSVLCSWIDLRATYKKFYQRKPNGLNGALQDVGIQFSGRQHSGLDDARNTAQLAWKMICDGCQMTITKSLDKNGKPLTKPVGINNKNRSAQTKSELCIHRPATSAKISHSDGQQIQRTSKDFEGKKLLQASTITKSPDCSKSSEDSEFKQIRQHTPTLIKPSSSLTKSKIIVKPSRQEGDKKQDAGLRPDTVSRSFTAIRLQTQTTSHHQQNKNANKLTGTPSTSKIAHKVSSNFKTPQNNFKKIIRRYHQDGFCKNDDKENVCDEKFQIELLNKRICKSEEQNCVDLNASFIEIDEKENSIPDDGKDQISIKNSKSITPLGLLKCPMTTPTTKVRIFHSKIHTDFKPPKRNTILGYLDRNTRKSLGSLPTNRAPFAKKGSSNSNTDNFTTPKNLHTLIREGNFKQPNFSTPKWATNSSLKEKITPPMCQCGRRTKRKIASKPGPNQNSPFFVCPKSNGYQSKSGCGYFQWESSVLKKNLNNYQNSLSSRYGSAVKIDTTPVIGNFGNVQGTSKILKTNLRTDFRLKPY